MVLPRHQFHRHNKKPIGFAAVRIGQNYVSFYLMPIYMNLKLQATISPELKKRQQGKACFNFAEVDGKLFAELKSLTKAGTECFKKLGYETPRETRRRSRRWFPGCSRLPAR